MKNMSELIDYKNIFNQLFELKMQIRKNLIRAEKSELDKNKDFVLYVQNVQSMNQIERNKRLDLINQLKNRLNIKTLEDFV